MPTSRKQSIRPSLRPARAHSGLYPISRPLGADAAEARIREITSRARDAGTDGSVDYHARVGAIVVAHLYDGNVGAWRRRKNTDLSLRKLAQQLSDVVHQSSLYRALAIYDLLERHVKIAGIRSLGVRALGAIARAPTDKQAALLARASEERWTGAKVENHVRQLPPKSTRGRRRSPALLRDLTRTAGVVETFGATALEKLDTETLRHCLDLAASIADDFDRLHKAVADALRVKEKQRLAAPAVGKTRGKKKVDATRGKRSGG